MKFREVVFSRFRIKFSITHTIFNYAHMTSQRFLHTHTTDRWRSTHEGLGSHHLGGQHLGGHHLGSHHLGSHHRGRGGNVHGHGLLHLHGHGLRHLHGHGLRTWHRLRNQLKYEAYAIRQWLETKCSLIQHSCELNLKQMVL